MKKQKRRLAYDSNRNRYSLRLKTDFNLANGLTVDYVDPANLVYSYTEDPNFEDIYYVGEVKSVTLRRGQKTISLFNSDSDLEEIQKYPGVMSNYTRNYYAQDDQL